MFADITLRTLIEQCQEGINILGPDGQLQFMSPNGLRALQIEDFCEVAGRDWISLWPDASRSMVEAALTRARSGEPGRFQGFRPTFAGEPRWWDVSISPICDEVGTVQQILASSRDISYQYRDEGREEVLQGLVRQLTAERTRLSKARQEMGHAEKLRLLGQFVGGIIHDLNNVLAALQSASMLLRRRVEGPVALDILNHVDQAIERGSQLTRQLLDFSRNDAGLAEVLDLGDLIGRDEQLLRHLAGNDIEVAFEFDEDVPKVLAPSSRVRSVLFNLVANSRDAIEHPRRTGDSAANRIVVRLRGRTLFARKGDLAAGSYAVLEIQDSGAGMTSSVMQQLGQAFFTTKASGKGTGLGIPSAFELASMCGGTIEMDSAVGQGTTIRVVMAASPTRSNDLDKLDQETDATMHGNATVLVVENDEFLREHVVGTLRGLGYTVLEAAGAIGAIAMAVAATQVDLVVSDLNLGDSDGQDIAGRLRSRFPDMPIVFLSGTSGRGVPAGEIFLRKPVDEALLARVMLEQLGRLPARHLTTKLLLQSERLKGRLTNAAMITAYDFWRAACIAERQLPSPEMLVALDDLIAKTGWLIEVTGITDIPTFRFIKASAELEKRLGRALVGTYATAADEDVLGSLGRAMVRAMRGVAFYDYARIRAGNVRINFQRLILPLSGNGMDVTHLLGIVAFEEDTPSAVEGKLQ